MNSDPRSAKERLENISRTKDTVKRWRWLLGVGAFAVAALVGFATMDYWLMLPPYLRYTALTLLAVIAAAGIFGLRRLFRKATSLKEAALDTEAQQPNELDCVVSTAAEYATDKLTIKDKYEPQLAEALQTEAARRLAQIALPYGRKLLLPTAIFLMALLGLTLFFVFTPRAWTAVKRTILPWAKAQYTEVEVKPGDVEIPVGQ